MTELRAEESRGDVFLIKMAKVPRRGAAGSKQLSKLNANDMHGQHSPAETQSKQRPRVKQNEMEMHFVQTRAGVHFQTQAK